MRPQTKTIVSLSTDANGIFEDQTTAAAGTLTLDGALVSGGVAALPLTGKSAVAQQVSIEGVGNNSGVSFTISGTDADNRSIAEILAGANSGTATTTTFFQTITSITVNGAITGDVEGGWLNTTDIVTSSIPLNWREDNFALALRVNLKTDQNVTITSAGDDSAIVFVISGVDETGNSVIENLVGANAATARSDKVFSKVTEIDTIGNAGTVTAGSDSDADGLAQSQDPAANASLTFNGALVSGGVGVLTAAMTYTVDHTFDDVNSSTVPTWIATSGLDAQTTDTEGNIIVPVRAARLRLTAYTSGSVDLTAIQSR